MNNLFFLYIRTHSVLDKVMSVRKPHRDAARGGDIGERPKVPYIHTQNIYGSTHGHFYSISTSCARFITDKIHVPSGMPSESTVPTHASQNELCIIKCLTSNIFTIHTLYIDTFRIDT